MDEAGCLKTFWSNKLLKSYFNVLGTELLKRFKYYKKLTKQIIGVNRPALFNGLIIIGVRLEKEL